MAQDINFEKKAKYLLYTRKFFLFPEFWGDDKNLFAANASDWKCVKFVESNSGKVPDKKGIYAFVVQPDYSCLFDIKYLFYIGKTRRTLRKRFKEYLYEKDGKYKSRPKVMEMLTLYDGYLYFHFLELENEADIDNNEVKLLNTFVPCINAVIPIAKISPELRSIYESA